MTALVDLIAGLLLAWAVFRTQNLTSICVAVAYGAGLIASNYYAHDSLRPILTSIDAFLVVSMSELWKRTRDYRCRIIGTISMVSIAFSMLSAVSGITWNAYASTANAAVFVQIIVAGDMADGFMAWLGRGFERYFDGNNRFLRFVGFL